MPIKKNLRSFQILFAVLSMLRPSPVQANNGQASFTLTAHQIRKELTPVPLKGEEIILNAVPEKLDGLKDLADKCQKEKQKQNPNISIDEIHTDHIIQKRNDQQCGQSSAWEKSVHRSLKNTINRPLDFVGQGVQRTGEVIQNKSKKLPWGIRHLTNLTGEAIKGIGGLTQIINDTVTLTLPTTIIGRAPTDPLESLVDIPLQVIETSDNTMRHIGNTVHTAIQTPVELITDPLISIGEKTQTSFLSELGEEVQNISDGCLSISIRFPVIATDTITTTYRVAMGKFGVETPWRKTSNLSLGLSEEDSLPFSEQFIQAYHSCLQDNFNEKIIQDNQKNIKQQLEALSQQKNLPYNQIPSYVNEARYAISQEDTISSTSKTDQSALTTKKSQPINRGTPSSIKPTSPLLMENPSSSERQSDQNSMQHFLSSLQKGKND